jgi:hypothetical protein
MKKSLPQTFSSPPVSTEVYCKVSTYVDVGAFLLTDALLGRANQIDMSKREPFGRRIFARTNSEIMV